MSVTTDPNLWVIYGLVFLLGLLIGVFLTAGGRRKWKTRYDSEVDRRRELEKAHARARAAWADAGEGMARARLPARRRDQERPRPGRRPAALI